MNPSSEHESFHDSNMKDQNYQMRGLTSYFLIAGSFTLFLEFSGK